MKKFTVEGELPHGYEDEKGNIHTRFVMSEPTIRNEVDAMDKLTRDGQASETDLTFSIYLAAEQIESFGSLEKEMITADLLLELPQDDLIPIFAAQVDVKKKRSDSKRKSESTTNQTMFFVCMDTKVLMQ